MRFALLILLTVIHCAQLQAQNPGDAFFGASVVHDINIDYYDADWWDLMVANKAIDDATGENIYIPGVVTIDGLVLDSVGIRFRGNSSYGHVGTKKPLKLDFNEYIGGQKLDGLKKLNLANGFLDPSMMREKLFLDFLNENELTAPRCTYARVSFNGSYIGLYKVIEQIDKTFLNTHFDNKDGNLYKGEPDAPLVWEGPFQSAYYNNHELKTNDSLNDWSDLVNFIDRVNNTSFLGYRDMMNQEFNWEPYLKTWAANNLFGNLDSYMYLPHNYYLYFNTTTQKMEWITWDVSLAFGVYAFLIVPESESFDILYLTNDPAGRPLNHRLFEATGYQSIYLNAMCDYMHDDFTATKLFPKIDSLAAVIRPHLVQEPASNQMFTVQDFDHNIGYGRITFDVIGSIPGLKSFINSRRANVIGQMCEKEWSCSLGAYFNGEEELVNVYPNPSADGLVNVHFKVPEESTSVNYQLTDIYGRAVGSANSIPDEITGEETFLLNLSSGMYILQVEGGCTTETKKVIVR